MVRNINIIHGSYPSMVENKKDGIKLKLNNGEEIDTDLFIVSSTKLVDKISKDAFFLKDFKDIKVNVCKAKTDVTPHTWVSSVSNCVTRAVVYNDTGFTKHTVTGASYEPITGVLTLTIPDHGFTAGEKSNRPCT